MAKKPPEVTAANIAQCVTRFRAARPHVHCITNSVAQHFTANVLLASGATPSMTIAVEEVADFVAMADALLINLGTMDAERTRAIGHAVTTADSLKTPWALDPVFVQTSPARLNLAMRLLKQNPALVRCNGSEFEALFGIDAKQEQDGDNWPDTTIALTGKMDLIRNSQGSMCVANGSPTMDRVTAMGCSLAALAVGFMAIEEDHLLAATSALTFFALAGDHAARKSAGPGTFVPHFLDALANLDEDDIAEGARLL
ncbi:MAG: hydroxyethylthiazole kinase [Rhizobiaceae bacterium]|nr:hydroxyethylthiazole kinase [Rhizobiaceae bacterium]